MQELQKDLAAKGVVWLMVDSVNHEKFQLPHAGTGAQGNGRPKKSTRPPGWTTSSGDIGHLYGMKTTPHMFVIDKNGTLVYDGAIDDRPQPFGDPRTAKNYVRDAVDELLAGKPVEVSQTKPYGCGVQYAN